MPPPSTNLPPPLGVGLVLHPNAEYLDLCANLIHNTADFFELSPETLWQASPTGTPEPSTWSTTLANLLQKTSRPLVGHGLCLSPGTADTSDAEQARLNSWINRIAADHARFHFLWYTEHLGWSTDGSSTLQLPLPLPPTDESVRTVTARLNQLKRVLPIVGFENQVSYFNLGNASDQPPFWNRLAHEGDLWLLLDLHNAYTECLNANIDLAAYLHAIDLTRVLEIHLSGGTDSDPAWFPPNLQTAHTLRLDSHDAPVPEPVWQAFEKILPLCPNLRAVTIERLDGTLTQSDIPLYKEELLRAKKLLA